MPDFTIIEHRSIDSTNNYAMQLIDADKAQHGMTITTDTQTAGKGQRGNTWVDEPGQSLLMSVIVEPGREIAGQFAFNASVAAAIATVLQYLDDKWRIYIKWPNDIIVNDKKAGGILIENVLRGSRWAYSVIGFGLNVLQPQLSPELPYATSLKMECGRDLDIKQLRDSLRAAILSVVNQPLSNAAAMDIYNRYLYKRGRMQEFGDGSGKWQAMVIQAHDDGSLELRRNGTAARYYHGQVAWVWG